MSLNKQQAADYLNKTVRALENLVTKGKIQANRVKGTRGVIEWRFEQNELDRYKNQQKQEHQQELYVEPEKDIEALAPKDANTFTVQLIKSLETLAATKHTNTVPIESKLTLSLDEASQLSGFSTHQLRDAIKDGRLKAIPIGTTGKRKRIRRDDLATYIKKL